ncbi:30S ribosomal protein S1 [Campylobacter hyointestinalis subsp. hyointestinalis]|uniref:30S ribosomal protein S1 n=1 Tax=Campylobacter hyointestinalis subsp. hyointestinalis TaxID=91352 RepID=A0A0S4SPV3_CAMHY|nr:30S ribosomal protein S1 [Campylobacter hyointestinalis]MBT0612702.1 30S ribosomal protein S1 [Campylobacter hyointestinalis subsp. hyointestinalis]MDY2998669.1 30S ribosomal protein S1 [Campylobacter hyointestinalis]PPB52850.1 30S ribosomal protein S1 [Campylobacter hyointestinalis subsp. hyointestinalis]PPB57199.1 30S ribosomal protein S1 [Campylobacter hyointestinalis subsp. hyointestinalis]PPB62107.1 30S ribosomal protein S1 [Campylobacter hyointestinalis subsp. hyointestinalis]
MAEVNKNVRNDISDKMDYEEDFAAMFEESLKAEESTVCDGVIVNIKDTEVFVDVRKKSEGIMNISEITNNDGTLQYKIGDTIKVAITGSRNGRPIVSHKKALRKEKVKAFIDNFDENADNIYDAKIVSKNKGGFVALSNDDVEFFMPKSQSGFRDANQVINKTFKVKVLKIDKDEQSIIVSRKKLIDEDRKKRKEAIENIIDNTDIIEGTIKKITTYGMFVDVGGIDGLVHYSEISYKGPVNPNTLYKEGDKVDVKIIKYDTDKKHLSLSVKAATPDPWEEIKDSLEVGDTIKVTVSNIEPYGAFVDLGNDIEGFLHISEISWDKNIKNPKDFIKEGEELDVEVIEIDANDRRLRVSLKNLLPKPFDEFNAKFSEGDIVDGVVTTLTNFGAFVRIGALEGLLHNEDSSWDRNDKCKDIFKTGDNIQVKIIKIDDKNQKISLSQKDLKESPVTKYAKTHGNGDIVSGTIRDIKDFGVFVSLEDGVDALIRKEDIGNLDINSLKVGDSIEAAIAFIDEKKNRIRLSVRRLAKQKEREVLNEINDEGKMTLGDIIKEQLAD